MDNEVLDPEGAKERLKAWKGRIDRLAADTKAMSDRLQELRVTERDPRGMVQVTVDSTGALTDLHLTHQIEGVAPDAVARAVMETIRRAKARLADMSQEIIAETVGTESPAARAIADSVDKHLRPQAEEDTDPDDGRFADMAAEPPRPAMPHTPRPPATQPPRPARRAEDDDDDEPFELRL